MAARNYKGEESEQSKERHDRKVDAMAGEGSTAGKLKSGRKYKQSRLDEISRQSGIEPSRQTKSPQYGRSRMDSEGSQDTLKSRR